MIYIQYIYLKCSANLLLVGTVWGHMVHLILNFHGVLPPPEQDFLHTGLQRLTLKQPSCLFTPGTHSRENNKGLIINSRALASTRDSRTDGLTPVYIQTVQVVFLHSYTFIIIIILHNRTYIALLFI